jgi:hypothetical protein
MAQSMRSAAAGTERRALSGGRRAAAPRAAAPARRAQQQQQQAQQRPAAAAARAQGARAPTRVAAVASKEAAPQQQDAGTQVGRGVVGLGGGSRALPARRRLRDAATAAPARRDAPTRSLGPSRRRPGLANLRSLERGSRHCCPPAPPFTAPPSPNNKNPKEWVALVANAEFFCVDPQNEAMAEQLRERVRYFKEQGRDTDFYLVPNPAWLDARYPDLGRQVGRPCMALVSTDKTWIT